MKQMKRSHAALALLLVQLLLVLSVAAKYLYERKTRPRIWTRATQFDPNQPLRGRYLALQLLVDACALPRDQDHYQKGYKIFNGGEGSGSWNWKVSLDVENGHLVPTLQDHPRTPTDIEELTLRTDRPCSRAPIRSEVEFFIPDTATGPFPLQPGQELWVEVTMPPTGPPRPIQLALSTGAGFQPLRFE
jgi:hypothetical protein